MMSGDKRCGEGRKGGKMGESKRRVHEDGTLRNERGDGVQSGHSGEAK